MIADGERAIHPMTKRGTEKIPQSKQKIQLKPKSANSSTGSGNILWSIWSTMGVVDVYKEENVYICIGMLSLYSRESFSWADHSGFERVIG